MRKGPLVEELEGFFAEYAAAFNAADVDRLAALFHCPCLMVNGDGVALLGTETAVQANLAGLFQLHEQQGVHLATVEGMSSQSLGDGLALAAIDWKVERSGALPSWEFRNTYNLVSRAAAWKVVVSTTHGQ